MRMWMCSPKIMCRNHLLGEHKEIHMLVGSLKKKKRLDRYFTNNCLELKSIELRHLELVHEFIFRGYNHQSELDKYDYSYLPKDQQEYSIKAESSLIDLLSRCPSCRSRFVGFYGIETLKQLLGESVSW